MTQDQIQLILQNGISKKEPKIEKFIETHISWVFLTTENAYKIKKPLQFSFLNFSSLDKRLFFCQQEYHLNKRLAPKMYLGVLPVKKNNNGFEIGEAVEGQIVDYALWMKRMDFSRQMDLLLQQGEVNLKHIDGIATQLAVFHKHTTAVAPTNYVNDTHSKFADLSSVADILEVNIGTEAPIFIQQLVDFSCDFINVRRHRLEERATEGFVIDGHGDLHSKNIFLLDHPVIFDCIEFNDDFRQLDVLNDIAFLCMDLDSLGQEKFAAYFLEKYLQHNPCMPLKVDQELLHYYKMYRANVRLKVGALGLAQHKDQQNEKAVQGILTYYNLLKDYFQAMA